MKSNEFSRRKFLGVSAAAAGATIAAKTFLLDPMPMFADSPAACALELSGLECRAVGCWRTPFSCPGWSALQPVICMMDATY